MKILLFLLFRLINPVLLKYLQFIKGTIVTTKSLRELCIKILQKNRDLIVPFMTSLTLQMEVRPSESWFANINFLTEVSPLSRNIIFEMTAMSCVYKLSVCVSLNITFL